MSNETTWLITLSNGDYLLKVAFKFRNDLFSEDVKEFPLEPENKEKIMKYLPPHVQTAGKIIEVEDIFDSV